ncbi:MAG: hypothetical protein JW774_10130 [Candidatus Aureabacteria bacterium]|nr:hypothetical protein [Candidatus Auribacterota bacterium]
MKIGIDLHGVIDVYPELFSKLSSHWVKLGHEIHIITGKSHEEAYKEILSNQMIFTHFYSIFDYHQSKGTPMEKRNSGWWMDQTLWDQSKGEYCTRVGIRLHFDNDLHYAKWFPSDCTFIWVRRKGFEKVFELFQPSLYLT